jgi:hypothetical protein
LEELRRTPSPLGLFIPASICLEEVATETWQAVALVHLHLLEWSLLVLKQRVDGQYTPFLRRMRRMRGEIRW